MLKYYFILFSVLLLGACSLTDTDQPVPSYLIINEVDLFTTDNQGENTHKITDVWVYAENQLLGVFELPAKVPVLVNADTTNFIVFPGIRNNGEQSRAFIYRLLDIKEFTLPLAPGEEVEQNLTFKYQDNAIFEFVEEFENNDHIFNLKLNEESNVKIEITDEMVKSGSKAGKITLNTTDNFITVATLAEYQRSDIIGFDSYFEMDYKCEIPFLIGVVYLQDGIEITQPLIILNKKDDWNKIYIDFSDILSSPAIETYRIYVGAEIDSQDVDEGEIFLDNLKFVHL